MITNESPPVPATKHHLRLTYRQRQAVLNGPVLSRELRTKLETAGPGLTRVPLSQAELEELHRELIEVLICSSQPQTRIFEAVLVNVEQLLRSFQIDEREEWAAMGRRNRPRFDPRLAFRFKLTLEGIDPPIWRRIEVHDSSLEVFACILVLAMGWETEFEPHRLTIDGRHFGPKSTYGIPAADGVEDESAVTLSSLFPVGSLPRAGCFEFDPNASWKHDLEFEGHVRVDLGVEYPRLIEGERACPPDSTRGLEGYRQLMDQTIDDKPEDRSIPKRPRQLLFDPEAFDLSQLQHQLRFVDRKLAGYVHWCPQMA